MGFLWCKAEGNRYMVMDAVGMASGDELSVAVPPGQLAGIEKQQEERPGLYLGGWWHTHPGLSLFYSETDTQNQMWYQQGNEDGLGIVFDHTMVDVDFIGFKIFRLDAPDSFDYHEVPYTLEGFTGVGLREALAPLGIGDRILQRLAHHLGLAPVPPEEVLPDVEIPPNADPEEDVAEYIERSEDALASGQGRKALENALIARQIAEMGDDPEIKADANLAVAEAAAGEGLYQTALEYMMELQYQNEDGVLPYEDYYAGKIAAVRARVFKMEENIAGAIEQWQVASGHFLENENYDEAFTASQAAAEAYQQISANQLYLEQLQASLQVVSRALDDVDEDPEEWVGDRDRIQEEISRVKNAVRTQGIQRV